MSKKVTQQDTFAAPAAVFQQKAIRRSVGLLEEDAPTRPRLEPG